MTYGVVFICELLFGVWPVEDEVLGDEGVECVEDLLLGYIVHAYEERILHESTLCENGMLRCCEREVPLVLYLGMATFTYGARLSLDPLYRSLALQYTCILHFSDGRRVSVHNQKEGSVKYGLRKSFSSRFAPLPSRLCCIQIPANLSHRRLYPGSPQWTIQPQHSSQHNRLSSLLQ